MTVRDENESSEPTQASSPLADAASAGTPTTDSAPTQELKAEPAAASPAAENPAPSHSPAPAAPVSDAGAPAGQATERIAPLGSQAPLGSARSAGTSGSASPSTLAAPSVPAAPASPVSEAPTRPLGVSSPYTSVPSAPAGYSFQRSAGSQGTIYPGATQNPYASQATAHPATPGPFAASSPKPAFTYGGSSADRPEFGEHAAASASQAGGPGLGATVGSTAGTSPSAPSAASTSNPAGTPSAGTPFAAPTGPTTPVSGPGQASSGVHNPSAPQGASFGAPAPLGAPALGTTTAARPRKQRRTPGWAGVITAAVIAALVASGGTAAGLHYFGATGTVVDAPAATTHTGGTTKEVTSTGTAPDWEAVSKAVGDSVVSITVATSSGTAMGSGVIYDSSGHIITNNHVVSGATQIQVTLADGRIFAATLTGTDPATDLAVIQLKNAPDDLTVASFGDSNSVVTGEDVMAIGNPLGLSSTVTTGIVSALDRPVVTTQEESNDSQSSSGQELPGGLGELLRPQSNTAKTYTNAIQIDAAINPGNSGGPLFDETGKVIGITSSIAQVSEESGSIGLGFAIPGNLVTKVADQLIKSGKATHAYLGVSISDGGAQADGVTRAGAEVGSVESGSPADKAGIKQGDVITAINGKATSQAAALTGFVRQYSAGDTVTLTLIRDGETKQAQVTLAEREDS